MIVLTGVLLHPDQEKIFRKHNVELSRLLNIDLLLPYLNQHGLLTRDEPEDLDNPLPLLPPKSANCPYGCLVKVPGFCTDLFTVFSSLLRNALLTRSLKIVYKEQFASMLLTNEVSEVSK